jgi:hypothetical protein
MAICLDGDDNLEGTTTGEAKEMEDSAAKDFATKNFGDAYRVPMVALLQLS